jgi:hypothetical protein
VKTGAYNEPAVSPYISVPSPQDPRMGEWVDIRFEMLGTNGEMCMVCGADVNVISSSSELYI